MVGAEQTRGKDPPARKPKDCKRSKIMRNGGRNGHNGPAPIPESPTNSHVEDSSSNDASDPSTDDSSAIAVNISAKLLVLALLFNAALAFCLGTASRIILLANAGVDLTQLSTAPSRPGESTKSIIKLPRLQVSKNRMKDVPRTSFTTKLFYMEHAFTTSNTVHLDRRGSISEDEVPVDPPKADGDDEEDSSDDSSDDDENGQGTDEHLPNGHHLLVDIRGVDSAFLNSEERVATAMVRLIEESHVSVHTWPGEGVAILDLFTCGSTDPLIHMLSAIEELFAIPSGGMKARGDEPSPFGPRMLWSHKLRGFREVGKAHENPLEQDLGIDLLGKHNLDMKNELVSGETDFQHVHIYQLINPRFNSIASYERSLYDGKGSYESLHPEMFKPEKILYLDGVQQSTAFGDASYHEALVHPSMINHPNPRRVAIVGGGEGATLREVLKHRSVVEVVMVEIDGELVGMCREHMPEFSDCSDLLGSDAESCFDDSRATVEFRDAFGWFIDNFGRGEPKRERFDVIIMDALDPDKVVEIVGALYKDDSFIVSLYEGLTDDGVLVVQLGESDALRDPPHEAGPSKDTAHMVETLIDAGFDSMHIYDEGHSKFFAPWSYLVNFKSSKSRARWYESAAYFEVELHKRLHQTKSGKPALVYFDASEMMGYQLPRKVDEVIHCRKDDSPPECKRVFRGTNTKLVNPVSKLEARKRKVNAAGDPGDLGLSKATYSPVTERHLREILGSSPFREDTKTETR